MSRFIETSLMYVFLFQPPILFYLRRKLKWRISGVLLVSLSFLLGWLLLFAFGIIAKLNSPDDGFPLAFVVFFMLMGGWLFSGGLLLLWSPVIVFFSTKNRKIKLAMSLIILVLIILAGFLHVWSPYDWDVPDNRLIHDDTTFAGFDRTTYRVFEAKNDLLKQKLIRRWDLKPTQTFPDGRGPISFGEVDKHKPEWWQSQDVLDKLERYYFVHDSDEIYCNLWYDPNNQRLYMENGNW